MASNVPSMPTLAEIMRRMGLFPCKDCKERHVGCHGECERYKADVEAARAKQNEIFAKRNKENIAESAVLEWHKKRKAMWMKRRGK